MPDRPAVRGRQAAHVTDVDRALELDPVRGRQAHRTSLTRPGCSRPDASAQKTSSATSMMRVVGGLDDLAAGHQLGQHGAGEEPGDRQLALVEGLVGRPTGRCRPAAASAIEACRSSSQPIARSPQDISSRVVFSPTL